MYHIVSRLLQPLLTVTGLSAPQTYLDTCEQGQIQLDPSNRIKCWLCELVEIHWWNKSILQRVLLRPVGGGFLGAAGLLKIQELTSLAFFARSPVFKAWCPSVCGKRKTTRTTIQINPRKNLPTSPANPASLICLLQPSEPATKDWSVDTWKGTRIARKQIQNCKKTWEHKLKLQGVKQCLIRTKTEMTLSTRLQKLRSINDKAVTCSVNSFPIC